MYFDLAKFLQKLQEFVIEKILKPFLITERIKKKLQKNYEWD